MSEATNLLVEDDPNDAALIKRAFRKANLENPVHHLDNAVLTSSRESADVNRAYDEGANSYLVKPVSFENLVETVRALDVYWLILNEPPEMA